MKTLKSVQVPDEFLHSVGGEAAAREEVTRLIVIELVRKHVLGRGKGAQMLRLNRMEFDDLLAEHEIPAFELLPGETMAEHLREGEETLRQIRAS